MQKNRKFLSILLIAILAFSTVILFQSLPLTEATDTLLFSVFTSLCTGTYNSINTNTTNPTSGQQEGMYQTFVTPNDGNAYNLTSVNFDLGKGGSPTGTIVAKLFADSAAWGSEGHPTGSTLATSNTVDISTLPTTAALTSFTFSTPYTMTANTAYVMQVGENPTDCTPINSNYGYSMVNMTSDLTHGDAGLLRSSGYINGLGWYIPIQVYGVSSVANPSYSLPSPSYSNTKVGTSTVFSCEWINGTNALSKVLYSTNATGSWSWNNTATLTSIDSTHFWANFTVTLTTTTNATIDYFWIANDTSNNWVTSMSNQTFTTTLWYIPTALCESGTDTAIIFFANTNTTNPTAGKDEAIGQSFKTPNDGNYYNLTSVQFDLDKAGSPTGNIYAELFAHTGTFGSTGIPTGSVLATSNPIDISTLTLWGSFSMTTFTFATPYTLSPNTAYFIMVGYNTVDLTPDTNFGATCVNYTGNSAYGNCVELQSSGYVLQGTWVTPINIYGIQTSAPIGLTVNGVSLTQVTYIYGRNIVGGPAIATVTLVNGIAIGTAASLSDPNIILIHS